MIVTVTIKLSLVGPKLGDLTDRCEDCKTEPGAIRKVQTVCRYTEKKNEATYESYR